MESPQLQYFLSKITQFRIFFGNHSKHSASVNGLDIDELPKGRKIQSTAPIYLAAPRPCAQVLE